MQKKSFWPIIIGLICLLVVLGFVVVGWKSPLIFLPGGTGVSDTLDDFFWGDKLKTKRNEAILSKTNEAVISKTVEKDKKGNIVKTIEINKYDSGKTVWDWLSLLGVPFTLFYLGAWLQQEQRKIADNETKEEVLQTYFDRLSVLLIDRNLIMLSKKSQLSKTTPEEQETSNKSQSSTITAEEQELLNSALNIIRARTLSILRRFENDAKRKTSVMNFLIETGIVSNLKLNLSGVNLSGADLSWANLEKAELLEANLSWANLEQANLSGTDLFGAKFFGANLLGANLEKAELLGAKFFGAKLSEADLSRAKLLAANFSGANFSGANLKDILWDSNTVWPDKIAFTDAKNIPEKLKKELGKLLII